ncbi:hypothetical protein Glove_177g21 [Diversispora epigaea]|uniref:Protein kinase domain-containing protein n=1 Tax=Diversispora epigaea TaxID=1348612 RepID=A0A397INA7_9GLOM|nr:hypothetical protein Glove_177g21 [Diversispora epigaea]
MGGGANHWEVIEWIPYDRFKDVKQIGKGEFGTIHYAMWIDGKLENGILKNDNGEEIFDNFVNFNDVLNEMAINLKARTELASIKFYGITQDPETLSYMMVLNYAKDGNHREYLKINFNNINWFQKSYNLWHLSYRLKNIHKLDIIHKTFILEIFYQTILKIHNSDFRFWTKRWDTRVSHRPTLKELDSELWKYYKDYRDYLKEWENEDSEIVIQIKKAEEFSANQESINTTTTTTTTPLNSQTHPQAIYTS